MKHKGKVAFMVFEMSFQGMIPNGFKEEKPSMTKIELQCTFICSFNNNSLIVSILCPSG